jgi:hypothetical protein
MQDLDTNSTVGKPSGEVRFRATIWESSPIAGTTKLQQAFGMLPNAILAGSALVYGVGMVIENLNLQRYGLFHPDFVRVEYLMVGLLWITLVLLSSAIAIYFSDEWKQFVVSYRSSRKLKHCVVLLSTAAGALGLLYQGLGQILTRPSVFGKDFWIAVLVLSYNVVGVRLLFGFVRSCPAAESGGVAESLLRHLTSKKVEVCRTLFLCLGAVTTYAIFLFPRLNPALGGGDRQQVELVVKADKTAVAQRIPVKLSKDGRLGPLPLLVQDNDSFTVLEGTGNTSYALRISKDLVDAVIYHRSK